MTKSQELYRPSASNPACRAFTRYTHVTEDPSNISCSRDTWMGGGRISNGAEGQSQRFEISDRPDYVRHNEINCQSQFPPFYPHRMGAHPFARARERERKVCTRSNARDGNQATPLRNVNYKALGLPESSGPVTPVSTLLFPSVAVIFNEKKLIRDQS